MKIKIYDWRGILICVAASWPVVHAVVERYGKIGPVMLEVEMM